MSNSSPSTFSGDFQYGLKTWMLVTVGMAAAALLLQVLLEGAVAASSVIPHANWLDWLNFFGVFAGAPACVLWIGGRRPLVSVIWPRLALAVGIGLYAYQMLAHHGNGLSSASAVLCLIMAPLGVLALLVSLTGIRATDQAERGEWSKLYFKTVVLLGALGIATNAGLHSNRLLYPATWDYFVYRIDGAFNGLATHIAILNASAPPVVQAYTTATYGLLVFALYAMLGLAMRQNAMRRLGAWRTLIVPFVLAFFLYSMLPLSGPVSAFFSGEFPNRMPSPASVQAALVVIPPAYRNGMPSMHFTGALLVWMLAVGVQQRIAIWAAAALVLSTAWATLATGEHYVLDLVVAMPFAAFLGSALIWPARLRAQWRTAVPIWLAGALFLTWLILLRVVPEWLSNQLDLVRALSLLSVLVAAVVFYGMVRRSWPSGAVLPERLASTIAQGAARTTPRWVLTTFFISGLAGLLYEVIYAKALAVTFGSTALASYTVLATFMGGIALGAWLGGYVADRLPSPLRAYAVCQALIGLYAVATPQLFHLIQTIYVHLALNANPDAAWLTPLRVALGAACLGLPTILMGATLPLMFKHLRSLGVSSGSAIAPLYAASVVGAAIGSVIGAYFLLPMVGRNGGTFIAAVLNLVVGMYVLDRAKRVSADPYSVPGAIAAQPPASANLLGSRRSGIVAMAVLFVGGGVATCLEIDSMHLLEAVAGDTTYAVALIVAAFLAGLGLGSFACEGLMRRYSRLTLIAWAQCGIALAISLTAQQWDAIPSYFASFSIYPVQLSFSAREAIRALVCATALLPSGFLIGLSYPAAMSLVTDWLSPGPGAKGLGIASGLNTLGSIFGVVLIGYWLLPDLGLRKTALLLALVALGLGAIASMAGWGLAESTHSGRANSRALRWAPFVAAIIGLLFFPSTWNYGDLSSGANVYFAAQRWGKVIDHAESLEGGLTAVARARNDVSVLLTNGSFRGANSSASAGPTDESFVLFPLLNTAKREDALVIGYGTGMTTRVLHDLGFGHIDVAEPSQDVVVLANRYFGRINHGVSTQRGVSVHYADGRNYLLTQTRTFDVISINVTPIWSPDTAGLYNQDFYALAKMRLSNQGVLQQRVPMHNMTPVDLAYVIGSVRSELKYVWLYVQGGQGIIVASNNAKALQYPGEKLLTNSLHDDDDQLLPAQLLKCMVLSPAGVDNLVRSFDPTMHSLVSTDQNLYLEYSTPKGNALGDVVTSNIALLSGFEPRGSSTTKQQGKKAATEP